MTTTNPLASMLKTAFTKVDQNKDGKLDAAEYQSFYEVLRPGLPVDKENRPLVSPRDCFNRMDANRDGGVTESEMLTTGVLMPAELSGDGSLDAMVQYLLEQGTANAATAASLLAHMDKPVDET